MTQRTIESAATIGFRVKTGRAIAAVVAGPVLSPRLLERREVQLWDPALPETRAPYHAALELAEAAAEGPAVSSHAREGVVCIGDEFEGRRPGTAIVPHLRRSSLDANQSRPYGRAYSSAGPSGLNQF